LWVYNDDADQQQNGLIAPTRGRVRRRRIEHRAAFYPVVLQLIRVIVFPRTQCW